MWIQSKIGGATTQDWANLPYDVLSLICKKIPVAVDYFRFRKVCKSWRNVAITDGNNLLPQPPFLMLAQPKNIDPNARIPSSFVGFSEFNKIYELHLPEARHTLRLGSLGNWVVLEDSNQNIDLLNPFSRVVNELPRFKPSDVWGEDANDDEFAYFMKVVLSSTPTLENPGDCIAMGITSGFSHGYWLCFARLGGESWRTVSRTLESEESEDEILDVLFFKGYFYTISVSNALSRGFVSVCDIDGVDPPKDTIIISISMEKYDPETLRGYLVELAGELLLVLYYELETYTFESDDYDEEEEDKLLEGMNADEIEAFTKRIVPTVELYKLDLSTKTKEKVESLGQYCLFVGCNSSVSVLASNSTPWKRDCIYFTEEDYSYTKDSTKVGYQVFDFEDGSMKSHHIEYPAHSRPALWVIPKSVNRSIICD